jgi:hypothetical protein
MELNPPVGVLSEGILNQDNKEKTTALVHLQTDMLERFISKTHRSNIFWSLISGFLVFVMVCNFIAWRKVSNES